MKKFAQALCLAMFSVFFLFCLAACDAENMGSLKDISRPYAGMYVCKELSLGGRDMRGDFEEITLELKQDGSFVLLYETKEGNRGGYNGTYGLDSEKGEISLTARQGKRDKSFTFPYRNGTIYIDYNLFGTLLHASFGAN